MRNSPTRADFKANSGTIHDEGRGRRWRLLGKARRLLPDVVEKPVRGDPGRTVAHRVYRVACCHRDLDTAGQPPSIRRSPDGQHAHYVGLQRCGSVWHCPVCAPPIAAERRDEMNAAIAAWLKQGGAVYFVTRTMHHNAADNGQGELVATLAALAAVIDRHKAGRRYQAINASIGRKGSITAKEVTYGELNGWHPHTHELVFAAPGQLERLRSLRNDYVRQLVKRGLAGIKGGASRQERAERLRYLRRHAMTVQPGEFAAEYVAKFGCEPERERGGRWGIGSEMTRAHLKVGRRFDEGTPQRCDHAGPWGLLNDALDGDDRSGVLWREYGQAFQGKRQLIWSKGLRAYFFGTVERSDEEIAASADARCTEDVLQLNGWEWSRVLAHDARWNVLRVAAVNGADAVRLYIQGLSVIDKPREDGRFREPKLHLAAA